MPEQSWITPSGQEVLVTARIHRVPALGPVTDVAVSLRSGRARARLDRDRSDLVATVAHELRSPLTGVKGFVQALLNRWDRLNDEQKKLMLTTVHADSDRLSRLITELLDVARLDTGRLSHAPAELRRRDAHRPRHRQRPRRSPAPHRVPSARPTCPRSGPTRTSSPRSSPTWSRTPSATAIRSRHGDRVRGGRPRSSVQVDDSGDGIAPEIRQRAFTKFWTTGQRGGSGLGMYLVNGLVRAHGGTVTIDDAPDGGARIITTWPAFDSNA